MNKKRRFNNIYISFIIPIVIVYILPALYIYVLNRTSKHYYFTNKYNWILIVLSIILVMSAYKLSNKKSYEVLYYIIGILIGLLSIKFPFTINSIVIQNFMQTTIHQYILIIGYIILILNVLLKYVKGNVNNVKNKKTK